MIILEVLKEINYQSNKKNMRNYEPNLRVSYGRKDFINMVKRKLNIKDSFPMSWYEILKLTYYCTKNNSLVYNYLINK